jgi:hypothetical protein
VLGAEHPPDPAIRGISPAGVIDDNLVPTHHHLEVREAFVFFDSVVFDRRVAPTKHDLLREEFVFRATILPDILPGPLELLFEATQARKCSPSRTASRWVGSPLHGVVRGWVHPISSVVNDFEIIGVIDHSIWGAANDKDVFGTDHPPYPRITDISTADIDNFTNYLVAADHRSFRINIVLRRRRTSFPNSALASPTGT